MAVPAQAGAAGCSSCAPSEPRVEADTTDDYRSIDVRWLKREGLLSPGISRLITWSRRGEDTGSINIRSESGRIILAYQHQRYGEDWLDRSYPVYLDTTPCHMGGERHWFLCPNRRISSSSSRASRSPDNERSATVAKALCESLEIPGASGM